MGQDAIIKCKGLTKSFGSVHVLRGIDLQIMPRTLTSIVGASGAGKTTLLQILGTLLAPDEGEISIDSQDLRKLNTRQLASFRNRSIGFVFQFHHLLPELNAWENVCVPALIGRQHLRTAKSRALELLDYLGLSARAEHKPQQLSGGEQQRVAIARALMNEPKLVLADEPTGNLDTANRNELHNLFLRLRDDLGQTFVIVTHDPQLASRSDHSLTIRDGQIAN